MLNKIDQQNETIITLIIQTREPGGRLPEWSQLPQVRGNERDGGKEDLCWKVLRPGSRRQGKQTETHDIFMRIWGKWGGRRGKGRQGERSRQEGNRKERDTCEGVVSAQKLTQRTRGNLHVCLARGPKGLTLPSLQGMPLPHPGSWAGDRKGCRQSVESELEQVTDCLSASISWFHLRVTGVARPSEGACDDSVRGHMLPA